MQRQYFTTQKEIIMISKIAISFAALFIAALGVPLAWAESAGHTMVMPDELKWADVGSLPPGAKLAVIEGPMDQAVPFTVRLKMPANYQVPAHSHPAIEHVTVLSGSFYMGLGDKLDKSKSKKLSVGSVGIMQPKTNHFAWTKNETVIQLHGVGPWGINYVNPKDDPRKK